MLLIDPVFIVLIISVVANLVMLAAVARSHSARVRMGILNASITQVLLLVYVVLSLGWFAVQGIHRLQSLNIIIGFDLFALDRIALYILLALAGIFFQLTRVFQRKTGPGWLGWLAGLVFLAGSAFFYENAPRAFGMPLADALYRGSLPRPVGAFIIDRYLTAYDLLTVGWLALIASSVILTVRGYRETASPLHRNRIHYWMTAGALTLVGEALFLYRLPVPAILVYILSEGLCVYVLMTHNLPDLRMAMRRSASYLIMLLVTVAVYTGGFYAIQLIFKNVPGYNPLVAGAVLAFALAVLFNPLLDAVQRFVSRLITGARYDSRQTLSEYSMSISNILDMEVLATVVVGLISEAMEITHGALVTVSHEPGLFTGEGETGWSKVFISEDEGLGLVAGEGEHYLLRSMSGLGQEIPEGRISAKNPVAYYLKREHRPLLQYDIDLQPRFHIMEPAERDWLAGLKMDVFVPIYTKDRWIGMLALGSKTSGDRYYDEDLGLLQTLADQTAVALENARLYDDLKQRNLENESLNEELKRANSELARLDRAKSDFINIASHELRTPLTQVIGFNDILGEMIKANELRPAEGAQMVNSVRRAARRLEEIVETMFDVSKLDTKTLDLMHAPVSLSSVITVAIDTWAKGLEERKQIVSVRGLATLPTVVADGKRLTQVFSHLIQNAIKSTPDGGQIRVSGRVVDDTSAGNGNAVNELLERIEEKEPAPEAVEIRSIRSQKSVDSVLAASALAASAPAASALLAPITGPASNGQADKSGAEALSAAAASAGAVPGNTERFIEIVISDTGIGIASDDLERIFEKFYRVGNVLLHSTGDTKFKGAGPGLGLTIARGIIEAHGGRIWAESPGYDEEHCPGAKFHVLLPIRTSMSDLGKAK